MRGPLKALGQHKTKVVFVQLGSPKSPSVKDVRHYLKEFLGDPRVVDFTPWVWKIILNLFVLPFRPKKSAKAYARLWDGKQFPLISNTHSFTNKVRKALPHPEQIEVEEAYLLSSPRIEDVWSCWEQQVLKGESRPATKVLAIAMFPQYSESTVASGMDAFAKVLSGKVLIPPFEFMTDFHMAKCFIDNSVRLIDQNLSQWKNEGRAADKLVISFHGIPKRRVTHKFDPYYQHCFETFWLLKKFITEIESDKIEMTFQSRFGSEEWLTPYTDASAVAWVEEGHKRLAFYCPSFVADCLETTDEIGNELGHELKELGGEVLLIPCLNDDDQWCQDFARFIDDHELSHKQTNIDNFHTLSKEDYKHMPAVELKSPPLSDNAKSSLKIVFLTLFLDLVGFSIIFPLFPALADYYLKTDRDNFFLRLIFDSIQTWTSAGETNFNSLVLFGGALGALYSFLQFVAAPIWGTISDRIGRRPVLLISVFGLMLSYGFWFFAGSFTILILGRIIGGIMGGNISTATAVVADVTDKSNRSKGMATIGIAFALGFIIGPAMGGLFSLIKLNEIYPALVSYGVNPFSVPALVAGLLSLFNLVNLYSRFKETLPAEKRGQSESDRSINPIKLFKPLPFKGVNLTNFGYFFFLAAFSGMEFTLTFLAAERLAFTPMKNAYMFIFIGVVLTLVQGGYVRRKAHQIGEKRMALQGLVFVIPGLIAIAYAQSLFLLYVGLFFLAVGSSMTIPTLTSLVSLYTPAQHQGKSVGIFRSLGALARVIGPIVASLIYWRYGSSVPYFLGAAFLIIPIFLVSRLPKVEAN
ncbi:MAG: ferrochelatase [Bdellovibrio sp. CG12_big_fil_rev_8_21_14_0_65_39_13]|nr:MAG: ferrochelatase [Bdellovibrio sp. CG22_combo_CG10-13_8_21_14_all_39_27]PIQ61301.1 MAG: ferrochelatase [Bdellovibrio sp. CG12_big_fil_rev_8_21_14_0_65_39_13]PIR33610.1 MAG: ferrochelatase [Bdellovibrio sp. CG11_big_fil_rev_8_21_14_0_20_39_38]